MITENIEALEVTVAIAVLLKVRNDLEATAEETQACRAMRGGRGQKPRCVMNAVVLDCHMRHQTLKHHK